MCAMPSDPHGSPGDAGSARGRVSALYVYPIKSCGGVYLDAARIARHGFELDRRWMLVDATGSFLTQRTMPRMALVRVAIDEDALRVSAPGMPALRVPFGRSDGWPLTTEIWGDRPKAVTVDPTADAWFGRFLGVECRLVHMPDDALRRVDPDHAEAGDRVAFADGFPFLLTSEASLVDLCARAAMPLDMRRFRPNLVVSGFGPWAEDGWRRIRVGATEFRVAKPCGRCVVTTVDQDTAEVSKEPLRTLATFRKVGSKVLFGQNLIHDGEGVVRVGDRVDVSTAV